MIRRKSFTLIEIGLAIFILSLVGSVFIYNVNGLIAKHKFSRSLDDFFSNILRIRLLALSHEVDFDVKIVRSDKINGYEYLIKTDDVNMAKLLFKKKGENVFKSLVANGELYLNGSLLKDNFCFCITSKGYVDSGCRLVFCDNRKRAYEVIMDLLMFTNTKAKRACLTHEESS